VCNKIIVRLEKKRVPVQYSIPSLCPPYYKDRLSVCHFVCLIAPYTPNKCPVRGAFGRSV